MTTPPNDPPLTTVAPPETETAGVYGETTSTTEPRPVKTHEVMAHAKAHCKSCFGKGVLQVSSKPGELPHPVVCGCAFTRFMKKNQEKVTYHKEMHSWYWL